MIELAAFIAALFGACIGSFLNVVIYRLPQDGLSVAEPRHSFCPKCRTTLGVVDNIPVLSWLFLRGKCRHCRAPISVRYPTVELLTAVLFFITFKVHGEAVLEGGWALALPIAWCFFIAVLIAISFIDIDLQIIPDELSVTTAAIVPLCAWFIPGLPLDPAISPSFLDRFPDPHVAALSSRPLVLATVGVVSGVVTAFLFRRLSPAVGGGVRKWWETRLALVAGGLGGIVLYGVLAVQGWLANDANLALAGSLLGMFAGAGSIWSVGVLGKLAFRKDAMGFGDVKLMAFLGAALGWQQVLASIFIACLIGSVIGIAEKIRTGGSYLPFGPFLAAGALILVLADDQVRALFEWYTTLITPHR